MNGDRRKQLDNAITLIEQVKTIIEDVEGAEQEAFDNLSEGLQQSERGQAMEAAVSAIQNCTNNLDEAIDSINEAKGG